MSYVVQEPSNNGLGHSHADRNNALMVAMRFEQEYKLCFAYMPLGVPSFVCPRFTVFASRAERAVSPQSPMKGHHTTPHNMYMNERTNEQMSRCEP